MTLPTLTEHQTYALVDALQCFLDTADHRQPPDGIRTTAWIAEIQAADELANLIDTLTWATDLRA